MGSNERRERERLEVRQKILDAARELVAEQGFDAVTMRKIAEKIEYSPTAIYLHFADKTELVRELCDDDFAALAEQFFEITKGQDPIERLKRIGAAYVDFGLDRPNHYRVMFMTPFPPGTETPAASRIEQGNPEQDGYAFVRASVEAVMEAGLLRDELTDAHLVTQVIWAGVHGVVSLHIAKKNDEWVEWRPARATALLMIDALVRGILKDPR